MFCHTQDTDIFAGGCNTAINACYLTKGADENLESTPML